MANKGKRYQAAAALVEHGRLYDPLASLEIVGSFPAAKCDETVLATVCLAVDPAKNDQVVRAGVVLPKGLGKTRRIIVFAKGEKVQEATDAGADEAGLDDLIEKIADGWTDFDVAIATPDVMGNVAKVAKVLGPRGLMPNPKLGTVTMDVTKAVTAIKSGQIEVRVDKAGVVHAPVGRRSFDAAKLNENVQFLISELNRMKPASAKGRYMQSFVVSATMGAGVRVDLGTL